MKKRLLIPSLLLAPAAAVLAEDAHAILVYEDDAEQAWIIAASTTNIEYKTTPQGLNRIRKPRSEIKSVYFYEPPVFKEAVQLYESRDYAGAKAKFTECKAAFASVDNIVGNYGTLAGFYELECARKTFDLEGLKQLRDAYQFASLSRENHRNQLEIYDVWDAARTKSWARLDSLATRMLGEKKWTGEHLAQIHYCHGLALEGLDRPTDALIAFNGAFTADYTASEEITKKAALSCLRILQNHEEVKLAISLWGTEDEDTNSTGYFLLQEAVALCDLWKTALGGGQPLPSEYATFLKYRGASSIFDGGGSKKKSKETGPADKPAEKKADDKKPADKPAEKPAEKPADKKE